MLLEPETGILEPGMVVGAEAGASGGAFITALAEQLPARAILDFALAQPAEVVIWLRGMGSAPQGDAFQVALDGGPSWPVRFPPGADRPPWRWQRLQDEVGAASVHELAAGPHRLIVEAHAPDVRLDSLFLIADPGYIPGYVGGVVFIDSDGDGRRGPQERFGLARVSVRLRHQLTGEERQTLTDPYGRFYFSDVPVGHYQVSVYPPSGYWLPSREAIRSVALPGYAAAVTDLAFGLLQPTAVRVADLTAQRQEDAVVVRWLAMGNETETVTFAVERGPGSLGPFEQVAEVPVWGLTPTGIRFTWFDREGVAGWWYRLKLVDTGELFGPVVATALQAVHPVFWPRIHRGVVRYLVSGR
jgi:hypothetical protein